MPTHRPAPHTAAHVHPSSIVLPLHRRLACGRYVRRSTSMAGSRLNGFFSARCSSFLLVATTMRVEPQGSGMSAGFTSSCSRSSIRPAEEGVSGSRASNESHVGRLSGQLCMIVRQPQGAVSQIVRHQSQHCPLRNSETMPAANHLSALCRRSQTARPRRR